MVPVHTSRLLDGPRAQAGAGLGQEEVNPSHSPVKFGQVTAFPKA